MTSSRFGRNDLQRVLERLGKCEFVRDFNRAGKARFERDAEDGIRHHVLFHIERRHSIALIVTPVLIIDHEQARQVFDAERELGRSESEVGLVGSPLWEIARGMLNDRDSGGEYGLVTSDVAKLLNDQSPLGRGCWVSIEDLEELAQQIDIDLETVGAQFFRERDTIPKVTDWLKSDPAAGGTSKRIIILCLNYVQGQHDEVLKTVESWTEKTASPIELQFAEYIAERIRR